MACGSAVNAAYYYNIQMAPEKAFSFGNKVKGFWRDIIDSLRHISANDIFGFFRPIHGIIIEKIVDCIDDGKIPEFNCDAFVYNVYNKSNVIDHNKRKFNLHLISEILDNLGNVICHTLFC